jgi:hypothetical protein
MHFPRPFTAPTVYNPLSDIVGHWHARKIRTLEKHLGYGLRFRRIPAAWIQGCASFDLTSSWQAAGLNVTGIDYFTVGTVVRGRSTRFDSNAETFQSWIGGYLVRLNEDRPYTIQEHLNLAVVDQVNWLRHCGDPSPVCDLSVGGFQSAGKANISGYHGTVYVGGGYSHTDIGSGTQRTWLHVAAGVLAMAFNGNGAQPRVKAANLMPAATEVSYVRIFLKGIIIIVEIQPRVHAVLYGNGAVLKNRYGEDRDTFELIKDELFETLTATVITTA